MTTGATGNKERIGDCNALACATLVDEWIRLGVRHAVVSPGSRSTPLAVAIAARPELALHIVHDERAAAFIALGIGLAGVPSLLVSTSGTAAANFHPAVVEAGLSDIPMIVLTADRPPELRGVGAPQTIDQIGLFTTSVRTFVDAPVPDDVDGRVWRPLARDAFAAAVGVTDRPGPVHLNLPFREPLLGTAGQLPDPLPASVPVAAEPIDGAAAASLAALLNHRDGVIVCGGRAEVDAATVFDVARRLGWPVLADPCSGMRDQPGVITAFDSMLRVPSFVEAHRPSVILRFGRVPASKFLSNWSATIPVVQVGGPGVMNPEHNVVSFTDAATLTAAVASIADGAADAPSPWQTAWSDANAQAEAAIVASLDGYGDTPTEPGIARLVADTVASIEDAELVVSSSMPIRDVEWYGGPNANAYANRGANGIDGVTSTAIGRALTGHTVIELIGDIAFLHDSSALIGLARRDVDLRIVVVDNNGGGIFSFLPQHSELSGERFEQLFGTPHGADVVALATAHHLAAVTVTTMPELRKALTTPGPCVIHVRTDRTTNLDVHRQLNTAVATALSPDDD